MIYPEALASVVAGITNTWYHTQLSGPSLQFIESLSGILKLMLFYKNTKTLFVLFTFVFLLSVQRNFLQATWQNDTTALKYEVWLKNMVNI